MTDMAGLVGNAETHIPGLVERTETHLEISVWNTFEGDVVSKIWDGSRDDYDDLVEQYEDEPGYGVVIDREWEESVNDD